MTESTLITPEMTMEEILRRIPSAQRALFQRYHVGGCSSCGFQPTDSLEKVCKDHNLLDVNEVLRYLETAAEVDAKMAVTPDEVRAWLDEGRQFRFVDVRQPDEVAADPFEPAEALDYTNSSQYMDLPKDTLIVFTCADGGRSLDVASYFVGHKFTAIRSLQGGIASWRGASA
ncbi:MAG: rhodanese-like domain-containing protein [Planctomycetota bacterium]